VPWPCFLIEQTDRLELGLRRYADGPCPKMPGEHGYHNACTPIGRLRRKPTAPRGYEKLPPPVPKYEGDDRWPKRCACGRRFRKADHWQVWTERIWRPVADGRRFTLRTAPVGAMYDAGWLPDGYRGLDGAALTVALPPEGGWDVWHIDGPSSSGGRWERTGTPPKVTARPSILTPRYHGWLTDGVLSDPL
jgi:hypothetical protein